MESVNPATGETIAHFEPMPLGAVAGCIEAAVRARRSWAARPFAERAVPLRAAAALLRAERDRLARLMADEMGKPLAQGRAEAEKCAAACEFYAEHAERFLAPEPVKTDAARSYVAFAPLGVVLAVMPWNFPFWQVFRAAAPALMAGNAMLLKHASSVCGCALAIEDLLRRAGLPRDLFRALLIGSDRVPEVLAHPGVSAVTVTGSEAAGRAIGARAGELLKRSVLELGGSDPYVILEDADLAAAVQICVESRLINAGQSCIAAKRFILPERQRAELERLFVEHMRARRVGSPLEDGVDVGPLARADLRDQLHEQVERSIAKGARCLLGGTLPGGPGAFYAPTVLSGVSAGMAAYEEELFGPVASLIFVADEEEAIRVANDTSFGLGAAVFSRDVRRAEAIAATRLEAGSCFVNALVRSDPRLPFGGVKASGYGRELAAFGIREFVNVKTVYVA